MGVVNSTIALVTNCFKGKDKTKESNQIPIASDAQDQIPTQQPPLVSEQQQAEAALQVEHLASTAPIFPTRSHPSGASAAENPGSVKEGESVITNNRTPTNLEPSTKEEHKMASDEDYASFLDKANEDPSAGSAPKTQGNGKIEFKALDSGVKVPAVLEKVEAYYVSDADEEFVPVCLKLSGKGLPDEKTFAKLVNHPNPKDAHVSIMDIGEWDPRGQYKEVVDAVREAGKGSDVRVYRIEKGGTRVEYWVISVEDGKLVGVKALAVES